METKRPEEGEAMKSVSSEDEGEKWGRRLHDIRRDEFASEPGAITDGTPYAECHPATRGVYNRVAGRFRDKCVARYEEVVEAARRWLRWNGDSDSEVCEVYNLREALSALPDQGETPKDELPTRDFRAECVGQLVSQIRAAMAESLGDHAYCPLCGIKEGSIHSDGCLFAAVRDMLSAFPDQGEVTKDKPRPSDYELGSFAWNQGAGRHTLTDDQELNHKIICDLGAAIRATLGAKPLDTPAKQA